MLNCGFKQETPTGHNYLQMLAISKLAGRIYHVSIDGKTTKVSHAKWDSGSKWLLTYSFVMKRLDLSLTSKVRISNYLPPKYIYPSIISFMPCVISGKLSFPNNLNKRHAFMQSHVCNKQQINTMKIIHRKIVKVWQVWI